MSCGRANGLLDREVGDDEELVGLCQGRFVGLQAAFSLGGGGSMLAKDLNHLKEADVLDEVDKKGINRLLALSWLDERFSCNSPGFFSGYLMDIYRTRVTPSHWPTTRRLLLLHDKLSGLSDRSARQLLLLHGKSSSSKRPVAKATAVT